MRKPEDVIIDILNILLIISIVGILFSCIIGLA